MESLSFEHGYLTWLGSKIIPDRARLQYYLYDYENDIHYLNKDGQILLAENGIVWNEYLKPELELEKGKTSTPGNSDIRFLSYPKN